MTLVEMTAALGIAVVLMAALVGVSTQALRARAHASRRNDLHGQAGFALDQMARAVAGTRRLLLPLADKPGTSWRENVREETIPASSPEPGSIRATAVLAVTLPDDIDLDGDGTPDADNDGDGLLDEDPGADASNDGSAGIQGIDDAGDGYVDFGPSADDDEYFWQPDEDPVNGLDDDGDGNVDEDSGADASGDGCPGLCDVDDDADGTVDDGATSDDDEDGSSNEDWLDPLVFYLSGDTLMQRTPVPWDEDASGSLDGDDHVELPIASGVSRLRIERVPPVGDGTVQVDIELELADALGEAVRVGTRVRVGGAR
jgi:type II secretory pathway pseudopilin PulG